MAIFVRDLHKNGLLHNITMRHTNRSITFLLGAVFFINFLSINVSANAIAYCDLGDQANTGALTFIAFTEEITSNITSYQFLGSNSIEFTDNSPSFSITYSGNTADISIFKVGFSVGIYQGSGDVPSTLPLDEHLLLTYLKDFDKTAEEGSYAVSSILERNRYLPIHVLPPNNPADERNYSYIRIKSFDLTVQPNVTLVQDRDMNQRCMIKALSKFNSEFDINNMVGSRFYPKRFALDIHLPYIFHFRGVNNKIGVRFLGLDCPDSLKVSFFMDNHSEPFKTIQIPAQNIFRNILFVYNGSEDEEVYYYTNNSHSAFKCRIDAVYRNETAIAENKITIPTDPQKMNSSTIYSEDSVKLLFYKNQRVEP